MIAPSIDLNAAIIRHPLVVSPETTVLDAIALMNQDVPPDARPESSALSWDDPVLETHPSCVVVAHQRVVGILTERDVVRLTAQQHPLNQRTVGQVMSHPVVSLPEATFTDVGTATKLFQQHRIRHLPLLNEHGQLAGLVTRDSLRQVAWNQKLLRSQHQETLIAEMALRIRQYTQLETITTAIVEEVQHFLQADRVVMYQFQSDMSGTIIAEAVVPPWLPCLNLQINDTCFQTNLGGAYREGRVAMIDDVQGANLNPCYQELLEQFQVRANLVVPIVMPNAEERPLWGLLIAHQCAGPRRWDETDVRLLQRLSVQLAIALQQADLYQSLQDLNASLEQQVEARTRTLQTLANQERLQANIATQIRTSLDLETILNTAVQEIRAVLQCDRVNIWRFGSNWQPFVVAESTDSPHSLIGEWVNDTCLQNYAEIYRQGRIRVVPDIYTTEMTDCHREMLIRLQIRAEVLVPLLCGEQLWGLLNVTESQHSRDWQPGEVELLRVLSLKLAIALQQATTHRQLQEELSKRQQTEALQREKEAQSRALLTAIPDYLFRVGADGEYREVINRNRDISLLPAALNPVGSTLAEVLPADIAARHSHHLQQAISTGELQVYEQSIQVEDQLLYDEVRVVKSGEDEALFMIRDISVRKRLETERERAETALRESDQTNRAIIEAMPDLLIRMDRSGYYSQMLGGSAVQVQYPTLSPDLYRVLPPELAAQRLYAAGIALETGQLQVYEQLFEVEDDQRCEEIRIAPLNEREVLIIIRDITDRKRSISALAASEQRFRQLFEATPQIAVQGYDRDRRVIYWNPASEALYGYSQAEALGQKLEDLIISPEMRAGVIAAVDNWTAGGAAIPASELTLIDKQGFPVEVFSSHVMLNNLVGEQELYCVDIHIGALKRAEATLQNLSGGTAATMGQDFFPVLVSHIAEGLNVSYAIVTERVGDQLQTLALWAKGALQPNFSYLAAPTPCGQVLQTGRLYCPQSVQQQFPDCPELVEMGADSYLGIALKNTNGEAIGNLCIYHHQAIPDPQRAEQILQIFAARAAAELERQRATTALKQLNQALEVKVAERTAEVEVREARYRALVNAIPDLLIRIDADGTYLDVMTGDGIELFNADQIGPGVNIYDVTPFDHAQERMGYVHQALATREVQSYDYELIIGGRSISEEARIVAINDQEALIIVQDISERARLEAEVAERAAALQASEAQFRAMIRAVPDLLLRVTAAGVCLDCFQPQQSESFLPVQQHLAEVLPPELLQRQLDAITQAIATGRLQVYEHQFQKGDAITYEEVRISAIGPDEVLIMVRDTTQRKQSEGALQESQQFIQTILDTLPLSIFWKDRDCTFLGGNQRLLNAVGLQSEDQLIGKTDFDLAATEAKAMDYRADDQQVMASGQIQLAIEETLIAPNGEQIWLETHKAPLKNQTGDVIGIVGAFQDITQRKQAEAELKAKTQELQQSYQDLKETQLQLIQSEKMSSLGQLVAGIAHEINNPVSFIYGNLAAAQGYIADLQVIFNLYRETYPQPHSALQKALDEAEVNYVLEDFPRLLKSMENGAVRIRDIVASLRTFSRLDQSEYTAIDIHKNIDGTLIILQNRLNGRAGKPEIEVIKQYGALSPIECYSGLLNQVLMNLLVNAIDAIEAQQLQGASDYVGCITIQTRIVSKDKVSIAIKDNGTGMSADTQAQIFDPFFTTKPIGVGTGMGLSISYQIVTGNHQGQLLCHSVPGEGTTFCIELPQVVN